MYKQQIQALNTELYGRGGIHCARLGRKVRETECPPLVISANSAQLRDCLACPQGQRLAATSPFARVARPVPPVAPRPVTPLVVELPKRSKPAVQRKASAPAQAMPMPAVAVVPAAHPSLAERLAKLVSTLRGSL